MTDTGKSIRTRLLTIAKQENLTLQLVIIRYMQERLLYRISVSPYANNFCLKGGVLLYGYSREQTRPTMDIDFLGTDIPNEIKSIVSAFSQICSWKYTPDAVMFDAGSIVAEEIANRDEYPGIRLFVIAHLDTIRQRIQVDIGFGDVVIPSAVQLSYPTLLPESGIPVIRAYSLESVVAEKFEAMIDLSAANSRMKDFYDVYQIISTQKLRQDQLNAAIRETFRNRHTTYLPNHTLFSHEFPGNQSRVRQWKAFLSKNHLDQDLEFGLVMKSIVNTLLPIWESIPSA